MSRGKDLVFLLSATASHYFTKGLSLGGGHKDGGQRPSSSWPSRFIGLRLKSVSFEDSLFEECYFEDVTSSNTFFRNCTFINTVFYNTGKAEWLVAVTPKGWVDSGPRGPSLRVLKLSSLEPWRKVVWGLLASTDNPKNLMEIEHFLVVEYLTKISSFFVQN